MDPRFEQALRRGIEELGLVVDDGALRKLERFAERLLGWNRKVNLTAITDPAELAEKHFVDSLTLLPFIEGGRSLLDIGSGAGLPGMALACVRGDLEVTCCDSVGKKISFIKAISAELELRVRGVAVRAEGRPQKEMLPRAELVVSRALAEPAKWVPLGANYMAEGGKLFAMMGREVEESTLRAIGEGSGLELLSLEQFTLPISGAQRAIACWSR